MQTNFYHENAVESVMFVRWVQKKLPRVTLYDIDIGQEWPR